MLEWLRRRLIRPQISSSGLEIEARGAEDALVRGDFEQAAISYKNITKNWPSVAFAYSRRGRALLELGRRYEALYEFEQALKIDPGEPEALFSMGLMARALNNEIEALSYFKRAFSPPRQHIEAGLKLADASLAQGAVSAAIDTYEKVLTLNPGNIEANFGFGQAAMLLGREADANIAFHRALSMAPDFEPAKATTIFEKLFQKDSTRSPKPIRPLICIPIIPTFYNNWLGGHSYLVNFVRIISSLPKAQRPRVIVAALWDDELQFDNLRQLYETLFEATVVIGVVNSQAEMIKCKPLVKRIVRRRLGAFPPADHVAHDLMSVVDWTFPVLYPLWRVPGIPGPLFWIPDLQHRFLPLFFSAEEVSGRDRDMRALSLRSAPVVFSSSAARQDFHDHFQPARCRTHVWRFVSQLKMTGPVPCEDERDYKLPQRFYYTPNQFWRHKDHITLFHALRRILDQGHDVTFVCTGSDLSGASDEYSQELLQLINGLSLGQNLRLLGVLPRNKQIEIMRRCAAVIQPSLFEGWSTVVEDALSIGRPIIASDIPVHREQLSENGLFFDAGSADSLAAAVVSLDNKTNPGPDAEREVAALLDLEIRMKKSAQEFLNILARETTLRSQSQR